MFQFAVGGIFALGVLGALVLKGLALWKAAHREEKGWFIALLVINTLGLLELYYLFVVAKTTNKPENTKPPMGVPPVTIAPAMPQATTPPPGMTN